MSIDRQSRRMTADDYLSAAWTHCAPNRTPIDFPRGFWPDVARIAVEMAMQETLVPTLNFRPTMCDRGNFPEPKITSNRLKGLDLGKLEISI